mmetsp:Transcript_34562/g.120587  ORF Transcript_34562/g.120587 Transcript_34562/m.120587 type:complete len:325 (+) Transcript_34562:165-1139(+)
MSSFVESGLPVDDFLTTRPPKSPILLWQTVVLTSSYAPSDTARKQSLSCRVASPWSAWFFCWVLVTRLCWCMESCNTSSTDGIASLNLTPSRWAVAAAPMSSTLQTFEPILPARWAASREGLIASNPPLRTTRGRAIRCGPPASKKICFSLANPLSWKAPPSRKHASEHTASSGPSLTDCCSRFRYSLRFCIDASETARSAPSSMGWWPDAKALSSKDPKMRIGTRFDAAVAANGAASRTRCCSKMVSWTSRARRRSSFVASSRAAQTVSPTRSQRHSTVRRSCDVYSKCARVRCSAQRTEISLWIVAMPASDTSSTSSSSATS